MHKLNKHCGKNKYDSEYKCGSTDRDLNSLNFECSWASASCLSQISQRRVTETALTSQQRRKSSNGKVRLHPSQTLSIFLSQCRSHWRELGLFLHYLLLPFSLLARDALMNSWGVWWPQCMWEARGTPMLHLSELNHSSHARACR